MGTQPLEPGEWRSIRCYKPTKARPSWLAIAQFRDPAPPYRVRQRSKTGKTRVAARTALEETLTAEAAGSSPLDRQTKLRALWDEVLVEKRTKAAAGNLSDGTLRNYEGYWRNYIEAALGDVPISWLTVRRLDQYLRTLRESKGYATVKGVRNVLSEILDLAVRHDLINDNPIGKVADIRNDGPKRAQALPAAEAVWIWNRLQELANTPAEAVNNRHYRAMMCDQLVPDLWLFMLGTGLRISQALAVRWSWIDMETGIARVGPNVVRIRGKGLETNEGTSKSHRVRIALPDQVLAMLAMRQQPTTDPADPVFPSGKAGLLDPTNVSSKMLRPALIAIGRTDVSSHDCRRALASELNEAGLSLMEIAAQLTHADTRTTERHYIEKRAVNPRVKAVIKSVLSAPPEMRAVVELDARYSR